MALERTEELYKLLLSKGYPKEFCAEIAYKKYEYRLHCHQDAGIFVSGDRPKNRRFGG